MTWRDNPLFRQQAIRLLRRCNQPLVGLTILFVAGMIIQRSAWMENFYGLMANWGFLAEVFFGLASLILRFDIAVAILLQIMLWPSIEWKSMAPQVRLTLIRPEDHLLARVLPTAIILASLNLMNLVFVYTTIDIAGMFQAESLGRLTGYFVIVMGYMEDVSFGVICAFCAARRLGDEALRRSQAIVLAIRDLFVWGVLLMLSATAIFLIEAGLAIVRVTFGWDGPRDWYYFYLLTLPQALVLLMELGIIVYLWRVCSREYRDRWNRDEAASIP